jgi:hypothetical protein
MSIINPSVMMKNIVEERVESDLKRMIELFHQMGKPECVEAIARDKHSEDFTKDIYWLFYLMSDSIRNKVSILTHEKENPEEELSTGIEPWSKRWKVDPSEITDEYYEDFLVGQTEVGGWHPVFPLLQHFRAYDSYEYGFTGNTKRGDHVSIPIYTEGEEIYVMDISFHKGNMSWEIVGFPYRPVKIKKELYGLLTRYATR